MDDNFVFKSIGYIRSQSQYKYELPRQGIWAKNYAFLEFVKNFNLDVAAQDLVGFERIWLIFCFHLNIDKNWKPKVRPPISPDNKRYGVFATRSPHRLNPIGMSCVKLISVEKNGLIIANSDLLDGTPILDIKPYIPEVDAFHNSKAGWLDERKSDWFVLSFSRKANEQIDFVKKNNALDIRNFCQVQLSINPLDCERKRIVCVNKNDAIFDLGYRTWQVRYHVDEVNKKIEILEIFSNYKDEELNSHIDIYGDKEIHREFKKIFN